MNDRPLIKICGVKTPTIAFKSAKAGASLIGIIFEPSSRRYVTFAQAEAIVAAIKEGGAEPVAVFANATAKEILAICQQLNVDIVQLHGDVSRQEHALLPDYFRRVYVHQVNSSGQLVSKKMIAEKKLDNARDFLLFDHIDSGSGRTFAWKNLSHPHEIPFFLAGGLNKKNVLTALNQLKPAGIDVSSGVENNQGEKDEVLIAEFIRLLSNAEVKYGREVNHD